MLSERQVEKTVSESMSVHGVSNVNVSQRYDTEIGSTKVTVSKQIAGKSVAYQFTLEESFASQLGKDKYLKLKAEQASRQIVEELVEPISWNDGGMKICVHDGGWAKCNHCGTKVEIPLQKLAPAFTEDAELSTPRPLPKDPEHITEDMDGHQVVALKMYLAGKLREECGATCPTSKYHQKL